MPTAVIFDFGGVLIDWNPRHLYRKLFDDAEAMEHFLATVCTPAWNEQQDGGRPLAEATAVLTARFPEHTELIEAYYDRWTEMVGGPMEASIEVLAELRHREVPLYGLTNWSAETYPYVEGRYDFLDWFEGIVVSGREKLRKPDERIFRLLLERYGLDAPDTAFVDDNLDNIAAARRLGVHGVPFTTPGQLRLDLAALGLL